MNARTYGYGFVWLIASGTAAQHLEWAGNARDHADTLFIRSGVRPMD